MDLYTNVKAPLTRWLVQGGFLKEAFVVLDVGVQGGEQFRWNALGDHLVVHGFDALPSVIEGLTKNNANPSRVHYHWMALGNEDGEREFFVSSDPFSSSFNPATDGGRTVTGIRVPIRRLDTLLGEGLFPAPDALKTDVEAFETRVLAGAPRVLLGLSSFESESSFRVQRAYPNEHIFTLQRMAGEHRLLPADIQFERHPTTAFQSALERCGRPRVARLDWLGRPGTTNILFTHDYVQEAAYPETDASPSPKPTIDRLLKAMIVHELYGLGDVSLEIAEYFKEPLAQRLDVDRAIDLLVRESPRDPLEGRWLRNRARKLAQDLGCLSALRAVKRKWRG